MQLKERELLEEICYICGHRLHIEIEGGDVGCLRDILRVGLVRRGPGAATKRSLLLCLEMCKCRLKLGVPVIWQVSLKVLEVVGVDIDNASVDRWSMGINDIRDLSEKRASWSCGRLGGLIDLICVSVQHESLIFEGRATDLGEDVKSSMIWENLNP